MTYRDCVRQGIAAAEKAGLEDAGFQVRTLLCHIAGMDRTALALRAGEVVLPSVYERYRAALERLCGGEPLQYILGEWEFLGLDFSVGPGVLIPRPETELLAERAAELIQGRNAPVLYDLCAGSGCISIALAHRYPGAVFYAVEKSPDAFAYLEENIRRHGCRNVRPIAGDILEGPAQFRFPQADLILSNPPYVRTREISGLQPQVRLEPRMALDGGRDGLLFYRAILDLLTPALRDGGCLVLEIGEDQGACVGDLVKERFESAEVSRDYAGHDRVVSAIGKISLD
ncbi:MAG: peptide chain release factor N(5)-glutamine methyltransferase [Clostridiales bacterium]|nr:peptide chain release factor N(5)-glutamine methyltransferase [Clostridiales bacterium]